MKLQIKQLDGGDYTWQVVSSDDGEVICTSANQFMNWGGARLNFELMFRGLIGTIPTETV